MLIEVLLVILVLLVPFLIVVDVTRTQSEGGRGQPVETPSARVDAAGRRPVDIPLTAAGQEAGPAGHPTDGVEASASGDGGAVPAPAASPKTSRLALENLGVRSRLFLLVSIPTVTAVALGGLRVASSVRDDRATTSVFVDSAVVLVVLAVALVSTVLVGRSMLQQLRKLRAGALEVADVQLPAAVRRISESGGEGVSLDVKPVDVHTSDEIGEVARAFDQVHREALRLAANEAALRGNVNAIFVNLSRRSQSLVERLIRQIDDLEQGEQDAERLANLFQMDHLATRMRRNSENLLVLAGHDLSGRGHQPVALVDVLRAAVSEIEEYERVSVKVDPGIAVRAAAVNDVVHLLAELAENATSLSPPDAPVHVAGHLVASGGVLLNIVDQGVGMSADEMARANWQLENPPMVDVAVSRRMGLFVVGRLAARHGIRVQLRPATSGGLTALVLLPNEVITHDNPAVWSGPGGFDPAKPGAGLPETGFAALDHADRATAEQEVTVPRTPKVAPARSDAAELPLGPRRVPGAAGMWPGAAWTTTEAIPAFRPGREQTAGAPEPPAAGALPAAIAVEAAAAGQQPPVSGERAQSGPAIGEPAALTRQDAGLGDEPFRAPPSARSVVIVPSADSLAGENRLPIFEAVESDWFQRGHSADRSGRTWVSWADEGWRAAETVPAPSSGGLTPAGLPKRVPRANLVPGTAPNTPAAPARSAAATRERFAGFQRGVREGRAAVSSGADPYGEDETS